MSHKRAFGRTDLLACIGLLVLCLGFFWPVLGGDVLSPTEGLFFVDPLFAQHRSPDVSSWQNFILLADLTGMIYPWRHYTGQSLAAGRVPLWNPYSGCGMPLLANNQSAVLDPANLLFNSVLRPPVAQTASALFMLLLAALSTYALVRSLGGSPAGAFASGVTFGFSGFIFIWIGYPLAATAALLPLLLWATHRSADGPSAAGAAIIGLIVGWQFLSGHLSTSVQMLAFWAVFAVYAMVRRHATSPPGWARKYTAMLLTGLFLGCALGAAQLLPLKEYFDNSTIADAGRSRWATASNAESVRRSIFGDVGFLRSIAPGEVALLFNPEAHGHPAFHDYRQHPDYGNYAERTSYPGALALLALLAGLIRRPGPGHRRFFFFAAWVVFAVVLHLPVFNSVTYLPVLRLAAPQRMRFIFSLCVAVLLGLSLSEWLTARGRDRSRHLKLLAGVAVALACLSGAVAARALPHLAPGLGEMPDGIRMLRLAKLLAPAAAAIAFAIILLLAARGRLHVRPAASVLVALAVLDLLIFGARWHAICPPDRFFPLLQEIKQVRRLAGDGRVSGPPHIFRSNLAVVYECYDTRFYDPIAISRYTSLVEAAHGIPPGTNPSISLGSEQPNPLLLRLMSARLRWEMDPTGRPGLVRVSHPLPRAYVAPGVIARSAEEALDIVLTQLDPWQAAVVEGEAPPSSALGPVTPADITDYSPHRVTVRAEVSRPSWLVLTDAYFPGWRATVNGREARIVPANYAFRAVSVPAGESTVTFAYEPSSYRLGLFLTFLSIGAVAAILIAAAGRTMERRRQGNDVTAPEESGGKGSN